MDRTVITYLIATRLRAILVRRDGRPVVFGTLKKSAGAIFCARLRNLRLNTLNIPITANRWLPWRLR